MKDPETQPEANRSRPEGGKARERVKAFRLARGITAANADQVAAANAAGVAQAIALQAGLAQQAAQAQPQWHWLGPEFMPNGQTAVANTRNRIIVDPANGQHLLAATTAGLYESTDGGTTWAAQVLPGAPAAWDRLPVSIAPSDGSTAFAFGASAGTAYLWQRSGGTWSALALPAGMDITQAWYDWYVAAAPDKTSQVYLGAKDVYRGDLASGTWTWTDISAKSPGDCIHLDQHAIAFDPADPSTVYCGCDGGAFRSPDRGTSWTPLNAGLGITEIEYMALDNTTPG